MKKHLIVNTLVSLACIGLEPLYVWCGNWADTYSLGAEMVLGMLLPVVLALFILFAMFSVALSLYLAIVGKDIKQTLPILVFVVFAAIYLALATKDSFWVRVFEYYV